MSTMIFGCGRSMAVLVLLVLLVLSLAAMGVQAQTCPAGYSRIAPDGRYVDHGNGTVTDAETGLMWKQCSEGQIGAGCAIGSATKMTWSAALTAANTSSHAGFYDWRLPNIMELYSLVETGCHAPSINTTMFPTTPSWSYWSSTSKRAASEAWQVSFQYGTSHGGAGIKSDNVAVRLVRGGQGLDAFAAENGVAQIWRLELVGSDTFVGVAGAALQAPRPTVRVRNGNDDPVQGILFLFEITGGNGSIASGGSVVATDANGEAEVGAWTLDRDASAGNALRATLVGRGDIPALGFNASGAEEADLAVVKTSTTTSARVGDSVDYLIIVTNAGPSNATSVHVLDALPTQLDVGSARWICVQSGGAVCATTSGSGDVSLNGSVPVGGSLTILLSVTVLDNASQSNFDNTVVINLLSGVDGNSANDEATHNITILPPLAPHIFTDGFEGMAAPPFASNGIAAVGLSLDASMLQEERGTRRLLRVPDATGGTAVELVGFRRDSTLWVRLGGVGSEGRTLRSRWIELRDGPLSVSWHQERDGIRYMVGAADRTVDLQLPGMGAPKTLLAPAGITIH